MIVSSALARSLGLCERATTVAAGRAPGFRELALVGLGLLAAVIVVFHQQFADLNRVPNYGDPLFSMWRIGWVAHQVVRDPIHLFDANIFYPQPATLTYSDSMLLPAFIAAPMIWAGVPLPLVYQALFFGALLTSGLATYALARAFDLARGGAWISALVFTLCQYRIEHYSHLELQMTMWMPLTLLAAHRLLATGRTQYLVALGLVAGAQWYSSLYYGFFLTIYAGVFIAVLAAIWRAGWIRFAAVIGGLWLGIGIALPLARAYTSTEAVRGDRTADIVQLYSARPIDWLQPHTGSRWYRDVHWVKREEERQLFPNISPLALGAIGALPPFTAPRLAILISGLVAFDGSLGFNGHWYATAYRALHPMKSMRVPARQAILVHLTLALLAGVGACRIASWNKSTSVRRLALGAITIVFVIETMPDLRLIPVWRTVPSLYASLGPDSGAVLLEYPIHPNPGAYGENVPYLYFSTTHWTPMVNGYSGFRPDSYTQLAAASDGFPQGDSVAYLQRLGVTHVGLHCALWEVDACAITADRLANDPRFRLLVSTTWQGKPARLYELAR